MTCPFRFAPSLTLCGVSLPGPLIHCRPSLDRSPHILTQPSVWPGDDRPQSSPLTDYPKALHQRVFSSLYFSFTESTATCNYIFICLFMTLMAASFTRL